MNMQAGILEAAEIAPPQHQPAICAEASGSTTCTAAGYTANANAPTIALCQKLLAAGLDPDRALEVFRNGTLVLRIRSIAQGAALTVEDDRFGKPVFRRNRAAGAGMAASMRQNGEAAP